MSDVLVRQLHQVLEPWNALEGDSEEATAGVRSRSAEAWGCGTAQEALAHSRAATTKLELARAALALFTSNAGSFRPPLVKVFRFLFDHIDELRDDVAHLKMEQLAWQQGEADRAAGAGASVFLTGGTADEQNAVASAYEKVRMTESRMAALVEEASVQRDHFKSQIEAQRKQQYHLEDLLQHQMELTQTLLDHRLRQELVGGGGGGGGGGGPSGAAANGEGGVGGQTAAGGAAARGDAAAADGAQGSSAGGEAGRRPAERRDAAYVQRLVTRADRELTLERTEDQLRDLRVLQDELEKKVQSLLKLNTKYARQCVELSARLSIIHENNVALAADVQLYQRDCLKEQQRSQNLLHALLVARGIVLTTLQVQPGFHSEEMLEQVDAIDRTSDNPQWKRYDADVATQTSRLQAAKAKAAGTSTKPSQPPTTAAVAAVRSEDSSPLQLDPADELEEALRVIPHRGIRRQIQDLLNVDDVDHGGKIRTALLQFLELETELRAQTQQQQQQQGGPFATPVESDAWLSVPPAHNWIPPCGMRHAVPRHLRCANAVPLLVLHPLLAEAFVHELATQRRRLLAFAQVQLEQARASAAPSDSGGGGGAMIELQQLSATASANSLVSFSNFIELFVLVVWLNRADRYLPLLPATERSRLEAEAAIREDAHARRVSRVVAASSTGRGKFKGGGGGGRGGPESVSGGRVSGFRTTLWELRHVLHLVRPSTEASSLPPEGLQLTYALDVASRQTNAGPLTYAYGLTSRGVLCEVLFCVLRAERETLLSLCRTVDAAMVAATESQQRMSSVGLQQQQQQQQQATGEEKATTSTVAVDTNGGDQSSRVRGWVPTVQFIRALFALYPGYPQRRLEQLIDAAVEEGTAGSESPATLFYEALLPGRSLPGPTTAATAADTSLASTTRFASLFYAAVCDDALASMQVVEDSVANFVQGQSGGGGGGGEAEGDGAMSVTARQITSNAFLGLPRHESQQWVAGLRSAIHRWPRLRSTIADPGKGPPSSAKQSAPAGAREEAEADQVSSVAQVSTTEVMPYLRQNIVVRRGLFANAETGAAAGNGMASSATGTTPAVAPPSRVTAAKAPPPPPTVGEAADSDGSDGWTPAQARLLQHWETQWAQYSKLFPSVAATALASGPTTVAEYVELLRHLDPYRTRPWGSALVCGGSAVIHPLNYAEGWPDEALDIVHVSAAAAVVPEAALKSAMAKAGKKSGKRAGGASR